MKITVVGAGAVGASCAEYIAIKNFASEVVLLDIKENYAEGKAMDLMQTASLNNFDTRIIGSTNDYSKTEGSSIAVITSGIPRKPGMTREELIGINAGIVKEVSKNLIKYSPEVIIIIVSNPMDTMTYLTQKIGRQFRKLRFEIGETQNSDSSTPKGNKNALLATTILPKQSKRN